MTATPQDRAKLIADTVYDSVSRQIQEAIKADPSMAQLSAFVSEAVDGFYIDTGEFPTLIRKDELLAKPISEWFKVVADKRHAMDVKLPEPLVKGVADLQGDALLSALEQRAATKAAQVKPEPETVEEPAVDD